MGTANTSWHNVVSGSWDTRCTIWPLDADDDDDYGYSGLLHQLSFGDFFISSS